MAWLRISKQASLGLGLSRIKGIIVRGAANYEALIGKRPNELRKVEPRGSASPSVFP